MGWGAEWRRRCHRRRVHGAAIRTNGFGPVKVFTAVTAKHDCGSVTATGGLCTKVPQVVVKTRSISTFTPPSGDRFKARAAQFELVMEGRSCGREQIIHDIRRER
jgi:hypothetical protein